VQGQPWGEGSEGEGIQSDASSAVQQVLSGNERDGKRGDFAIPGYLSERQRALLKATSEELASGSAECALTLA
jgi:hypothetical protein